MSQQVMDYDPRWPELYEREAARLHSVLTTWALRIDHVGSTAVPGLAAKPVIDIQVAVQDQAAIGAVRALLLMHGYTEATTPIRFFHQPACWPHTHHVHVRVAGSYEEVRLRAFRDWLRSHPADRLSYEELKRELASSSNLFRPEERTRYSEAKTSFVREIESRAGVSPSTSLSEPSQT
ncbi:MAG: GrpB family protein [Polyangiales bacterium]